MVRATSFARGEQYCQINMFTHATNASSSQASKRVRVLVVGEAPGHRPTMPDFDDLPIVAVVRRWLTDAGLSDEEVYFANVYLDSAMTVPSRIQDIVHEVDAEVIVTLGRTAAHEFVETYKAVGLTIGNTVVYEDGSRFRVVVPFLSDHTRQLNGEVGTRLMREAVDALRLVRQSSSHGG